MRSAVYSRGSLVEDAPSTAHFAKKLAQRLKVGCGGEGTASVHSIANDPTSTPGDLQPAQRQDEAQSPHNLPHRGRPQRRTVDPRPVPPTGGPATYRRIRHVTTRVRKTNGGVVAVERGCARTGGLGQGLRVMTRRPRRRQACAGGDAQWDDSLAALWR